MLANTAEGIENAVIVSERVGKNPDEVLESDVQSVWNAISVSKEEAKKRGKEPLGVQAGWNYGYLKKILLGDDSEGLTPAERKEIDLLVPKFKVNETSCDTNAIIYSFSYS